MLLRLAWEEFGLFALAGHAFIDTIMIAFAAPAKSADYTGPVFDAHQRWLHCDGLMQGYRAWDNAARLFGLN